METWNWRRKRWKDVYAGEKSAKQRKRKGHIRVYMSKKTHNTFPLAELLALVCNPKSLQGRKGGKLYLLSISHDDGELVVVVTKLLLTSACVSAAVHLPTWEMLLSWWTWKKHSPQYNCVNSNYSITINKPSLMYCRAASALKLRDSTWTFWRVFLLTILGYFFLYFHFSMRDITNTFNSNFANLSMTTITAAVCRCRTTDVTKLKWLFKPHHLNTELGACQTHCRVIIAHGCYKTALIYDSKWELCV